MPLARKLTRGRRRRAGRRKANKKIKKVVTRMLVSRGLSKPELKYHYTNILTGQQVTTTYLNNGVFLQPIGQGDDADNLPSTGQVIGLKYTAKYIDVYGHFFNTSTTSNHSIRLILIRDNQPYAGNSIIPYSSTANYNECLFQWPYQWSEFHSYKPRRFNVLMDQKIILGASSQDKAQKVVKRHINLRNTQISNTLNVASVNTFYPQNHQYILFIIGDGSTDSTVYSTLKTKFAYSDV